MLRGVDLLHLRHGGVHRRRAPAVVPDAAGDDLRHHPHGGDARQDAGAPHEIADAQRYLRECEAFDALPATTRADLLDEVALEEKRRRLAANAARIPCGATTALGPGSSGYAGQNTHHEVRHAVQASVLGHGGTMNRTFNFM